MRQDKRRSCVENKKFKRNNFSKKKKISIISKQTMEPFKNKYFVAMIACNAVQLHLFVLETN